MRVTSSYYISEYIDYSLVGKWIFFYFKIFKIFLILRGGRERESEREQEGEREREKHKCEREPSIGWAAFCMHPDQGPKPPT